MQHAGACCQTTGPGVLCCLLGCLCAGCFGGLAGRVQGAAFPLAWARQALAKEDNATQGWGQGGEAMFWLCREIQVGQSYCSLREKVRRQAGLHVRKCLPHALSLWLQTPRVPRPQKREMGGLGTAPSQSVPFHTPCVEQASLGSSRSHQHMGMARARAMLPLCVRWSYRRGPLLTRHLLC